MQAVPLEESFFPLEYDTMHKQTRIFAFLAHNSLL